MEELTKKLKDVDRSYPDFVEAVLLYVEKKAARLIAVEGYLDSNPDVTASDILEFISDQPDFYEKEISEDMEKMIV